MTAVLWAALPLLAVLGQQPPIRSAPAAEPAPTQEDPYRGAVDLYRARKYAAAFGAMERLTRKEIDAEVSSIERRRRSVTPPAEHPTASWTRRDVLAAGLLHGDIALTRAATSDNDNFNDSLRVAVRLLRIADTPQVGSSEEPRTWTRDWLRGTASLLLVYGLDGRTQEVLDLARSLFPDDGQLLLTRGMLEEFESTATVSWSSQFNGQFAKDDREKALQAAKDAFARALQAMPESDETRMKLAHVDVALKHDDWAIPLLERARKSAYPSPAYLATLMLGDIRMRQGRGSDAEALYRAAIKDSGGAQSAYLALSMLQYAAGRQAEAAATLDAMYAQRRTAPVEDPWWSYQLGLPQQPKAVLDALRAEAQQ